MNRKVKVLDLVTTVIENRIISTFGWRTSIDALVKMTVRKILESIN